MYDGAELERTIEDLYALRPGIRSLAVVPVGLTGYRQRLPQLRPPTVAEATAVLELLHGYQERFLTESGSRFVFAADEFYLQAGAEIPPLAAYEDLPQLENGVGMIAVFQQEAAEALNEAEPLVLPPVSTFTGQSAHPELTRYLVALSARTGVTIHLHPIRNDFFGGHVTVAGLLTGRDVVQQLRGKELGKVLLVPEVVLKDGEDIFLDDLSLPDLSRELGIPVRKIGSSPWGMLEALEYLAAEAPR